MADQTRRLILREEAFVPAQTVRSGQANSAVAVGLIGAGGRATYNAQLQVEHICARLVIVCDLFGDWIEVARPRIPAHEAYVCKDFRNLLASPIDTTLIAMPDFLYPEHIEAAVEADQNIYIEKPAGADVEGCKRLMLTADSAPRRLNIAFRFPQRFAPLSRKARQPVASSGIGRLTAAHSHWRRRGVHGSEKPESRPTNELERLRQWQNWRDTGGDFIMESYGRAVNVLSWFCGCHPLKAVAPANRTLARRGDLRDQCTVSCIHPKAIRGSRASTHPAAAWNGEVTWAETMA